MDNHIIQECFIDTILMETLLPTKVGYNHQKGCSVFKAMKSKNLLDDFSLGIIDKDKKPAPYSQEFGLLIAKYDVELRKHPSRNHFLIIHPPIEKWLIAECKQVNLLLENYDLPSDFRGLMKITKPITSKNDNRLIRLFKALKKNNAPGITQIFKWTYYLINNPYNADETILIQQGNLS